MAIVETKVIVKGGYDRRGEPAHSIQYKVGDDTHAFLEMGQERCVVFEGSRVTEKSEM